MADDRRYCNNYYIYFDLFKELDYCGFDDMIGRILTIRTLRNSCVFMDKMYFGGYLDKNSFFNLSI